MASQTDEESLAIGSTQAPVSFKSDNASRKDGSKSKLYKRKTGFFKLCTPWVTFFMSEPDRFRSMKMLLGFPVGAVLALGLYMLVIKPMAFPEETQRIIGLLMVIGIAAGFSMSASVRCVCFLLIPTFLGKAGRSFIGTFAIAFLISGPIENIVGNMQDITRSLTCSTELAINHTRAKWQFRLHPISNVLKDMQEQGFMLGSIGKKVELAFTPIRSEIRGEEDVAKMERRTIDEDEMEGGQIDRVANIKQETKVAVTNDEAQIVERKYRMKIKLQCEDVYNKAVEGCRKVFTNVVDKCKNTVPAIINFICKIVDFSWLCILVEPIGKALGGECRTEDVMKPSFGKIYQRSEESINSMNKGFNVEMQFKVVASKEDIDYTSVEQMRSSTMHEFKQGRKWVEFILTLIKRFLGFTFLLVVFGSYKYYTKFMTDVKFDNNYITHYYRKIDARRKLKGKKFLLPLKKIEKSHCIYPSSLKLMKAERSKLGKGIFLLLLQALLSGLVFFTAHILYTVMDIIRKHSQIDFKQSGINHMEVKVAGHGFVSQIVRMFVNGLNTKNTLHHITSNLDCLPRPEQVDQEYYLFVFGIYFIILLLILLDAYALRLRKSTAAFFFRKREKMRILHLYNNMLNKRKSFLRLMKRKVKKKAKKLQLSSRSGILYSLRRQFPTVCSCLNLCTASRDICLICEERLSGENLIKCDTPQCSFTYCKECWFDVKKKCYACLPLEEFSSTDSDTTSSQSDDDIN